MTITIATCAVRLDHAGRSTPCPEPQVAVCDVPVSEGVVELALCAEHYGELRRANDPIKLAQNWLA